MTAPRFLLALFAVALAARVAAADDAVTRGARRHFERGEKLYALTRFSEALAEYQLAFDARPIPDFLFNIGQCYRNLGDYDAAIFSYRKYLTAAPEAPNRAQVEQLIRELGAEQARSDTRRLGLARGRPAPAAATAPTAPDPPIYTRWWFWTGVAVIGAAGGVTIYETTRSGGPPSTGLGNIVFGK
jgi:tetratricopeptide (TPR) repeat protein